MSNIKAIIIDPKEPRVQMPIRVPEGLKSFIEGAASELGYSVNEYVVRVFTALMEQDYE